MNQFTPQTHATFQGLWHSSKPAVEVLRRMLLDKIGFYEVIIQEQTLAETHEEWREHSDNGDTLCRWRPESPQIIIECKHLQNTWFTRREDFPWKERPDRPWWGYIVDNDSKLVRYEKKGVWPYAFFNMSADLKFFGLVSGSTKDQWSTRMGKEGTTGFEKLMRFAPLEIVQFGSVDNPKIRTLTGRMT